MTRLRQGCAGQVVLPLFAMADRRAAEADVVSAAVAYVLDREGRWGSAASRYRALVRAVRTLKRPGAGHPMNRERRP